MISEQRRIWAAAVGATGSPDGGTGAVPLTSTRSPETTAREKPMLFS